MTTAFKEKPKTMFWLSFSSPQHFYVNGLELNTWLFSVNFLKNIYGSITKYCHQGAKIYIQFLCTIQVL